jgi:hypothetical protein
MWCLIKPEIKVLFILSVSVVHLCNVTATVNGINIHDYKEEFNWTGIF